MGSHKTLSAMRMMFVSIINKMMNWESNIINSKHTYIIWDSEWTNWRYKFYKQYKSNRKNKFDNKEEKINFYEMRTSLRQHLRDRTIYKQILLNFFEADDVIGEFVRFYSTQKPTEPIIICANDKDFYQLLRTHNPPVIIRRIGTAQRIYTHMDFEKQYGIPASLWSSVKALGGCSTDAVPGVAGIGEKRAINLVKNYGHVLNWIDNVYRTGTTLSNWAFKARLESNNVKLYYKLVDLELNHSGMNLNLKKNVYSAFIE